MSAVPYDPEAEEDTIGSMLANPAALKLGLETCSSADFYGPGNARVFAAIENLYQRGTPVDVGTVAGELLQHGGEVGNHRVRLLEMLTNVVAVRNVEAYARIVVRHADARRLLGLCAETSQRLMAMKDPYEEADLLAADLSSIDAPVDESRAEAVTADDLLATADDASPWVVPGLLRRDWRALMVAGEGVGKSVILRQIAMMAAQGVHPFTLRDIRPVRTLVVDLENPVASIAETASRVVGRLRERVGTTYDPEACKFFRRPGGIDPRTRHGHGELEREIAAQRPELVCIGPAYKMLHRRSSRAGMESYEEATDPVLEVLDDLRTRHGFALLIEHHAPQGGAQREMRPYGSQRWLAWPEIGLNLKPDRERNSWVLGRFRGDRMTTNWPDSLSRGDVWPVQGRWTHGLKPEEPPVMDQPLSVD